MDFFCDLLAGMVDGETTNSVVVERAALFADEALKQAEQRWMGVKL
jgi:hypothetical protein